MPRLARAVALGQPHHITQRGNNRQDVFFTEQDRQLYLKLLQEQSKRYGLKIHAYCLMANHIHLVATPTQETSLAKGVGRAHWLYTQMVNGLHRRSGHLWQGRFYSCILDEEHFWTAVRYVERNPVRARLVRRAWEYPWSSAKAHMEGRDVPGLLWWQEFGPGQKGKRWQMFISQPEDQALLLRLRRGTKTGRALGGDGWLSRLESRLGRRLRPLPVGRPKKKVKARRRK